MVLAAGKVARIDTSELGHNSAELPDGLVALAVVLEPDSVVARYGRRRLLADMLALCILVLYGFTSRKHHERYCRKQAGLHEGFLEANGAR